MTLAPIYADAEGAVIAWAQSFPGLTGRGNPLSAGLHVTEIRSPAEGAVGYVEVVDRQRRRRVGHAAGVGRRCSRRVAASRRSPPARTGTRSTG
jgi:hypothetical protein